MDKLTKIKILRSLRSKYNEIEGKIHKKTMEMDRILDKKMRGRITLEQSNKLHNQLVRGYGYIQKWNDQLIGIDKSIHYIRNS